MAKPHIGTPHSRPSPTIRGPAPTKIDPRPAINIPARQPERPRPPSIDQSGSKGGAGK